MGNPGRPSGGCQNCKKSHVKCDERLPTCSLCTRRNLSCGYRSEFEIFLKDQTASVKENWGKRPRKARPRTTGNEGDLPGERTSTSTFRTAKSPTCVSLITQQRKVASHQWSPSAPRQPVFDREQFALSQWFSRWSSDLDLNESSPQGFLQLQPQLYAASKPNGALERATCAMALLGCSFRLEVVEARCSFFMTGRVAFGDAMRLIKEAVQDPEERQDDEILMAALVMNMVEAILVIDLISRKQWLLLTRNQSAVDRRPQSQAHLSGALALIKLRGSKNFKSEVARRMLTGVHSELVGLALRSSIPVQPILAEASPESWMEDMKALPTTSPARLSHHAEEVANLHAAVKLTLDSWHPLSEQPASELLNLLFKADQNLLGWEQDLPEAFFALPAADLSIANLTKFEAYANSMDTYADIWVAKMQNSFRLLRIMLQLLIRDVLHRVTIDRPSALPVGPISHFHTTQRLVDEVCASVPFFMGTKRVDLDPESVNFPHALGQAMTEVRGANNMRLGTWFIFAPLYACARCPDLRPGQSDWIQKQIGRLESLHFPVGGPQAPFLGLSDQYLKCSLFSMKCIDVNKRTDDDLMRVETLAMESRIVGAHLPSSR